MVLIFASKNLIRRYVAGRRPGGSEGVIEVLTRTSVSTKHEVMLIRVAERVLVVAAGGDGMNTLAEITDPEQVSRLLGAVQQKRAGSLSNAFSKALQGRQSEFAPDTEAPDDAGEDVSPTPAGSAAKRVKGVADKVRQLGSSFRRRG